MISRYFAAAALVLAASTAAHAAVDQYIFGFSGANAANKLTVNGATELAFLDQGWYFQSGVHDPTNPNYIAGICTSCSLSGEYRNWFAFDISRLADPVTSLSLTLFSYSVTLTSGNYYLNDYTGNVGNLINGTAGVAGFADLGGGVNFGFRFYQSATDSNAAHTIALDSNALASLNAAIAADDLRWAIGGAFTPGDTPVPPTIPEPGTLVLLGLGLGALAASRRRKL